MLINLMMIKWWLDTMPRSELIKKLRIRGLPIRLFAETDEKSLKRLRIELEKPEFNVGLKNDFQAALLLQVENEEVMEKISKGSTDTNEVEKLNIVIEESEEDATWEQIQLMRASSLGSGEHNKDCDLIFAFISYILKRWAKDLILA
ncbi:SFM domain-containing protein [Meloidogyne graminicola]|uniref:SFM domain-containing protein n=1 Tax=Meloidogyne graminicola TaxID=189291 RepID=A0A8S9ZMI0_9BILA|nr:SFM domain-containing protein [Meloidogyne graminicola]